MQPKTRGARKQDAALEAGKFCGVAAAMIGAAVVGGVAANSAAKKTAQATTDANNANIAANAVDPHVTAMLYGTGQRTLKPGVTAQYEDGPRRFDPESRTWSGGGMTNPDSDYTSGGGLLDRYQGLLDKPQAAGQSIYGQAGDNYIGKFGAGDMEQQRDAANKLMAGNVAAPSMQAAKVNAPEQNGLGLKGSYDSLINGPAGANPFLTGAIAKGINQSTTAFGNYLSDAKIATQDMLGSIRGGAQMAGGYGGSRQGLAEGKAIESMNTQLGRAASQFGQNNTDAAVAAQAGAYDSDRNRQLAATQGLSGQQYGVASQDASMQQGANQANMQSQQGTNQLNQAGTVAGMGGVGGLLGQASQVAGAQDNYDLNKAGQVNGLLQPYLSKNPVPTSIQPVFNNGGSAALGGAMAGLGMYGQLKSAFGTTPATSTAGGSGMMSAFGSSY